MLLAALATAFLNNQTSSQTQSIQDAASINKTLENLKSKSDELIAGKTARGIVKHFVENSATMTPQQAAEGWLKLFDSSQEPAQAASPITVADLISALPSPKSWPAISKGLDSRATKLGKPNFKSIGYRMLGHVLTNDIAAQRQDVAQMRKLEAANPQNGGQLSTSLEYSLAARSGDPNWVASAFRREIKSPNGTDPLPNYVALLGKESARRELKWVLTNSKFSLTPPSDIGDQVLVSQLLMDPDVKLGHPMWSLITSPQLAVKLVPMMLKLKGALDPSDAGNRLTARQFYCIGLLQEGKKKEAISNAANLSWERPSVLRQGRWNQPVLEILRGLAATQPTKVSWLQYINLANQDGHPEEALKLLDKLMSNPKTSDKTKSELQFPYVVSLLSADRVDDGITQLRKAIADAKNRSNVDDGSGYTPYFENGDLPTLLARLGVSLDRPELIQEAISDAKSNATSNQRYSYYGASNPLADYLTSIGRLEDAQKLVLDSLNSSTPFNGITPDVFLQLAKIYYRAGRPKDILTLADQCRYLSAPDLVGIYTTGYSPFEKVAAPCLGFYVAWALEETGDNDRAFQVLQPCLYLDNAFDPAYELLLKLKGDDALPILDALYKHDQFEERPLIWKGFLLKQQGKLDDAAAVLRQAISVDPSDGNEPHGDRLRAYDLLADVLIAQGKPEEATTFKSAVHAIREAEKADDLVEACLLSRAVKQYDSALNIFVDAYCIQSRLAVRLSEEGKSAEAAEHFRKAYELMPSSFGRVETHCFGCEGVFENVPAQHIAETVLGDIAKKTPENPKVHYLLGYLYEQEESVEKSLAEFRKATKLDPDYLNAWIHLATESQQVGGVNSDAAEAQLALIRLDPNSLHNTDVYFVGNRSTPVDLAKLWYTGQAVLPLVYHLPHTVYPLAASAASLRSRPDFTGEAGDYTFDYGMTSAPNTPGDWIDRSMLLQYITNLFETNGRRYRGGLE